MADTVANIQTRVRWLARDSVYSLIDTSGLSILNYNYRRLASIIPWSEFNREDTSRSTTANQEAVTWPTVSFVDINLVEMKDPADNLNYHEVVPARTEIEFSALRSQEPSFPEVYKRTHDGTQNVIKFAPAPQVSALTVRITGQIEPTALATSASTTAFIGTVPDDILAYMVAADIMDKRNQADRANKLLALAGELLSGLAGREIVPAELRSEPKIATN